MTKGVAFKSGLKKFGKRRELQGRGKTAKEKKIR